MNQPTEKPPPLNLRQKMAATMSMIKFAHTIFALPFALIGWAMGMAMVSEAGVMNPRLENLAVNSLHPWGAALGFAAAPWAWTLIWVVVAMFGARSFAMTFNRIVDRKLDAANPRTAGRELPTGVLSLGFAWGFTLASAAIFLAACAMLNPITLVLAPVALLIIGGYSLTKRWTVLCHLILGLGLALAPIGGWVAAAGRPWEIAGGFRFIPLGLDLWGDAALLAGNPTPPFLGIVFYPVSGWLGAGVLLWVAGFDVIYSLQDEEFDRAHSLKSLPALLGAKWALALSRAMHVMAILCWLVAIVNFNSEIQLFNSVATMGVYMNYDAEHYLGFISYAGLALVAACLLYEHSLVKHDDLRKVNAAFFTMNGIVSVVFAAMVILDLYL